MKVRLLLAGLCLTVLALSSEIAPLAAQQVVTSARLTEPAGAVSGTVINSLDKPVPAARLRLRELTSGRIIMTTRGDQEGRFQFTGVPAGSYVVELIDEQSRMMAISQSFQTAPAQTVGVMVRLSATLPWYNGFFTNAAIAAVSSAASLGVTAVGTGLQPTSGRF